MGIMEPRHSSTSKKKIISLPSLYYKGQYVVATNHIYSDLWLLPVQIAAAPELALMVVVNGQGN